MERRSLNRIQVRKNEGVSACLIVDQAKRDCQVIDITSSGFGLIVDEEYVIDQKVENQVKLEISLTTNRILQFDCIICNIEPKKDKKIRLGLLKIDKDPCKKEEYLPDKLSITGVMRHQFYYLEDIFFRVIGISKNRFDIVCYDPEVLIFPTMEISFRIFASLPQHEIHGEITCVEVKNNTTEFSVKVLFWEDEVKKHLGYYLLYNHNFKPFELRKMGFRIKEYKSIIKFRSVRSSEEYHNVLKLRRDGYVDAGKFPKDAKPEELASSLDSKSRILTAYHNDVLVGTATIVFPDNQQMILDTEKAFENGYPIALPPKTQMIEIGRLVITPKYRATDVLYGIFEHIFRILVTSERKYIISSSDDPMWPLYKKMGFKKVGLRYNHPVFKNIGHDIMLVEKKTLLFGASIKPIHWNEFYRKMSDHLIEIGIVKPNKYEKAMLLYNKTMIKLNITYKFLHKTIKTTFKKVYYRKKYW